MRTHSLNRPRPNFTLPDTSTGLLSYWPGRCSLVPEKDTVNSSPWRSRYSGTENEKFQPDTGTSGGRS